MKDGLRVVRFGAEAVVFNPVSWQTHLLNSTAVGALDALMAGPRSIDDIAVAILGPPTGVGLNAEDVTILDSLLCELESLGLVAADEAGRADR